VFKNQLSLELWEFLGEKAFGITLPPVQIANGDKWVAESTVCLNGKGNVFYMAT